MSRRNLWLATGGAVLAAGVLAAVLVTTSGGSKKPAAQLVGASEVAQLLGGIPQHGTTLGRPDAPTTVVEFADPQCPYCAVWAKQGLPDVLRTYVRTGKAKLVFNGLAFVGPDSETALRSALAAGRQNRFWNVIELLYANQGTENTGWVTDSLLRSVGAAVPGLDVRRMLDERSLASVAGQVESAAALAQSAGVNATPTFAVGPTGGTLQVVDAQSLAAALAQ